MDLEQKLFKTNKRRQAPEPVGSETEVSKADMIYDSYILVLDHFQNRSENARPPTYSLIAVS
jgi:hypothetical protein